jgi:hypothetical protein
MFRSNAEDGYVVVEFSIARMVFLWCFIGCDNPRVDLMVSLSVQRWCHAPVPIVLLPKLESHEYFLDGHS